MALGWLFLNSMAPNSAEKSARDSFELTRDRSQEVASNNPQLFTPERTVFLPPFCQHAGHGRSGDIPLRKTPT
jgi:hypothetical protein